jgi:hypothetical protein
MCYQLCGAISGVIVMASNGKRTSGGMASKAGSILGNPNASATAKSLAGSALAQAGTAKQTGARMEDRASQVLSSPKYSASTKALAGSVLSQSNKKR